MMRRVDVQIVIGLLLILVGFFLGIFGPWAGGRATSPEDHAGHSATDAKPAIWTCSMHPQIKLPSPGKCPICFMDLIPVEQGGDEQDSGYGLTMSPSAMKLAEIQTTPVTRGYPFHSVRMVGKVEYDETRVKSIAAWVAGRLDRLFVDYTGVTIRKGDHLVWMYSPELVSAQEELLQAIRAENELRGSQVDLLRETAASTIEATRDKLRLLGLTTEQIQEIEERGEIEDHITIYAPSDGIVIAKHAKEGMYVETGRSIYEIADLSHLWVKLDAYESDLVWLRYGQTIRFSTEAYPGEEFTGRIAFIDPVINPATRTVKVRVNVDNEDLLLKPEMFVRAHAESQVAAGGLVMSPDLSGKWISPMHPEIIKDKPGSCDVCGMPLVRVEDLGYQPAQKDEEAPLLIPASAPLITGRRAVVYVRDPSSEKPRFLGREVMLGPRAGDHYLVKEGLLDGELVVTNGAFKIDSAMQIQAMPSMMAPPGESAVSTHDHGGSEGPTPAPPIEQHATPHEFRNQLGALYQAYLSLVVALAGDDLQAARIAAESLPEFLSSVDMSLLDEAAHIAWMGILAELQPEVDEAAAAKDLSGLRDQVPGLTDSIARAVRVMGISEKATVLRFHCPMAFDGKGADWLQSEKETANPYYGDAMLRCGSEIETLSTEEGSQ